MLWQIIELAISWFLHIFISYHPFFTLLFSTYLYIYLYIYTCLKCLFQKNPSRKIPIILQNKDLLFLFVCKIQSSYFKTFLQCSITFVEFSRTFATEEGGVHSKGHNELIKQKDRLTLNNEFYSFYFHVEIVSYIKREKLKI